MSGAGSGAHAPNNTKQQPPQHFWQKPGCSDAMAETGIGVLVTGGAAAAAWFVGPEFFEIAGEGMELEAAESGPLAKVLVGVDIGHGVGSAAAAPLLLLSHGIAGVATDCF